MQSGNYVFTTEGHPIPVGHALMRRRLPQCRAGSETQRCKQASSASMDAHTDPQGAMPSFEQEGTSETSEEAAAVTSPAGEQGTEHGAASERGELGEREALQGQGVGAGGSAGLLGESEEPQCRAAVSARREQQLPLHWGWVHTNASALDALVCPDFTQVPPN